MIDIVVGWIARDSLRAHPERSAKVAELLAELSGPEQERARRFVDPDARIDFALGRWITRRLLHEATGVPPSGWEFVVGPHGRPSASTNERIRGAGIPDINITHGGGIVAAACMFGARVGIDAEAEDRQLPSRRIERFLAPEEHAALAAFDGSMHRTTFWRIWTLKEACLKALGTGIAGGLQSLAIDPALPTPRISRWDGADRSRVELHIAELRPRSRTLLAIACVGTPQQIPRVRQSEVRLS